MNVKEYMTVNKSATILKVHMSAAVLMDLSWTVMIEVAVVGI